METAGFLSARQIMVSKDCYEDVVDKKAMHMIFYVLPGSISWFHEADLDLVHNTAQKKT